MFCLISWGNEFLVSGLILGLCTPQEENQLRFYLISFLNLCSRSAGNLVNLWK